MWWGDSPKHNYIVQMDPLDGSSNIDVAISIGSIFGIWKRRAGEPVTDASLLRPGNEQVAAAYAVYGSSTVLVVATRDNVQGFTLDPESHAFGHTHPDIRIPAKNSLLQHQRRQLQKTRIRRPKRPCKN